MAAAVAAIGVGVAAVAGVGGAAPAGAGGGEPMSPVRDRYEPGQDVLFVGYTQAAQPQPATGGRYWAWLRVDPAAHARAEAAGGLYVDPADIRLAPVVIDGPPLEVPDYGRRASISFTLPDDVAPGHYALILCNDPCTEAPGYLIPEMLSVGVPPDYEVVRGWPATEPAIRWLEDDALLFGPSGEMVRAADYRAGRFPPPPTLAPTAGPATTVAEAPTSRVAGAARSRVPGEAPAPVVSRDPAPAHPQADADGGDWRPLGAWLGGLGALALVSGALVARGRRARRTTEELTEDLTEEPRAEEQALVRT
jgi:hypothetical protein